ncbi:hypothetical protein HYALB_00013849 [Hymenoscyphus albidus]|uniref:Uncharacterized protein n=1 Tax=Hymenoscyphus albidus TaxID=595503 RepID=A0A9N9LYE3_9HELO|nr:hypothetical protein HYALB_00013849 [Hymenoscyphus albidus]
MPFPFQTLPREIRDEIYKIVLCAIEPAPGRVQEQFSGILTTNTIIKHSIEPQILRVSHQIHDEAICDMTKTNLFVKVTSNIPSMKERFAQKRIPILNITKPDLKLFNAYVMHHTLRHIPENGRRSQEQDWVFIMLHRDLDELRFDCFERLYSSAICGTQGSIPSHLPS